ncbi:MAG: hypothetical protein IKP37_11435, partial [Paludibacteraceae bacterium]|nr:hypothetical protein [Paludibacteraceae bacterium]
MYKLIFKQVCFLFLVFSLSESCLLAQNDISGTILFKEDFGGNSPSDPIAKPTGIVQCSYDYNVNPLDYTGNGRYAIRKVGYQPHWEWYAPYDHTYPDDPDRGYFFQCDASTDKCTFYYAQVDDLCENMELYLSLWSMSCTQSPDPIYAHAYLRLVVENLDGDELASKDIVVENCKGYWEQFGLSFKVPSGSTSIVYKIINNADIINGNDFCLDDIEIRLRTPLPSVSAASEPACLGEPESLNVTFVNDGSIDEPLKYTWFRSDVPSYERSDWEKIGTFSELVFPEISADDSVYYRVMVSSNGGSTDMNNCSPISDVFKLNVDDCIDSIKAFVCIDNDVEKTSQTAYNCETTDHSIVLISDEWDKHFPSKYFYRWQYSSDGGLTWSKLDESEKSFLFDKSFDGLTYFRAILANSEDILEQFEYYDGLSSDNTKKVFVTNSVSIECSICEPPIFETVNDEVVVCEDLETPISLSVKQTNSSKVDKIEWFVKNDDDDKWTLLKGESKTTLTVNNPKKNSSYLFIAHNDDCLSDSLFFNIKVNVSIILEPLQDITVCENSDVEFSANVLKGAPVSYFWNGTPSDENTYKIADIQSDDEISLSATDGVCVSSEFTVRISVEKKAEVEIEPLPTQICEGSPVKLVAHAQLSPSNTFSWKKDGILLSDSELSISDIPTSDATYLFTVQ